MQYFDIKDWMFVLLKEKKRTEKTESLTDRNAVSFLHIFLIYFAFLLTVYFHNHMTYLIGIMTIGKQILFVLPCRLIIPLEL